MKKYFVVALLAVTLAVPALADGPETGVVTGVVTDAQGQPLPGVTVTIEGDRGTKAMMSESDGSYRFALLSPGSYKVQAELEGFQASASMVDVTAGSKQDLTLQMRLTTSETITVTSEAPMVDKFNVTAGATVTAEVGLQSAGTTRSYYGVVNMLPGVTSDADNRDIQDMRPSVNGSHFADQGVYIDGVDTTFSRLGGSRVILPTSATTEVTMEAGGASAEYGRVTGASTNVIIKSGTNKYHGEGLIGYSKVDWFSDYKTQPILPQIEFGPKPANFFKRQDIEWAQTDESYELSLGGPISRDKAWFFVAYNDSTQGNYDQTLNNSLIDTSVAYESTIAKLNFQPGTSHQIAVSWMDSPVTRIYSHTPQYDIWGPTPHNLSGDLASFTWNYSISSTVFLETKLAAQTSNEDKLLMTGGTDVVEAIHAKQQSPNGYPGDPALAAACAFASLDPRCSLPGNNYGVYADGADNQSWHNGWILDNGFGLNEYPRDQFNTAMTWFASENHELKFGFDWQQVEWLQDVHRQGFYQGDGFNPLELDGYDEQCGVIVGNFCSFQDYNPLELVEQGRGSSDSKNKNTTLYARDRFTVGDKWTFNIGLRASQQKNTNDIGRLVVDTFTVEPRFSGTYDIKGDGKMLASLNLGRYYAQLNQQFTNRWLMDEWTGWNAYDWYFWCDALDVALSDLFLGGACPAVGYNFLWYKNRPGEQFSLAEEGFFQVELDPYYKDEIILGFEWQFNRNWAFDAKGIYWELGDMIMNTEQRTPDGINRFQLSQNAKNMPAAWRSLGVVPDELIDAWQEPFKEYSALQLQLNKRFNGGWAMYNNLTLAKLETTGSGAWWDNSSSTYGEDLGTVLTQPMIDDCTAQQTNRTVPVNCQALLGPHLGEPLSTLNRAGRDGLGGGTGAGDGFYGSGVDRPYIWKTFGYKQFTIGKHLINIGGLFTYQSGAAWGRGETVDAPSPNDPTANELVVLESNGVRRLPSFYDLNLTTSWAFPLGNTVSGELRLTFTNVTDQQEQVNTNLYGEVTATRREFQRPRQIRSMLSLRF